jgi:hypothetical protein
MAERQNVQIEQDCGLSFVYDIALWKFPPFFYTALKKYNFSYEN